MTFDWMKFPRYFSVFLFLCMMFISCAYADETETVTPTPAATVVPSLFDDEEEEDAPDDVVSQDSVSVDDNDTDTEPVEEDSDGYTAADSGDSGDDDTDITVTPTPEPTATPEPTETPEPTVTPVPVTVFQITEQPESVYCEVGDTVTFTCSAVGVGVTWSWKYCDENGWYSCDEATAICPTLEVEVTEDCFNRIYACTVEDGNGNQLYSDDAYLYPAPEGYSDGYTEYGNEVLTVLGYILGLLVFFAVVELVKAVFRFFNIFF